MESVRSNTYVSNVLSKNCSDHFQETCQPDFASMFIFAWKYDKQQEEIEDIKGTLCL